MDFKRIQWIFLIVFIGINIFLGIEILQTPTLFSNDSTAISSGDNLQQEMIADNIKIPNVSNKQSDGYYLAANVDKTWVDKAQSQIKDTVNVSTSSVDGSINATLDNPIAISSNKKQAIKDLNKFKNNTRYVYLGDKYVYSPESSDRDDYVFLQKTEYGLIYAARARLHITVKDNKIVSYYQRYTDKVFPVRERQTTISSKEAINSLYTYSKLPNDSKVVWIKFGYTKLTQVRGSVIFLPSWLVAIENNTSKTVTVKRVNAFTGTIIQTQTTSDENKS